MVYPPVIQDLPTIATRRREAGCWATSVGDRRQQAENDAGQQGSQNRKAKAEMLQAPRKEKRLHHCSKRQHKEVAVGPRATRFDLFKIMVVTCQKHARFPMPTAAHSNWQLSGQASQLAFRGTQKKGVCFQITRRGGDRSAAPINGGGAATGRRRHGCRRTSRALHGHRCQSRGTAAPKAMEQRRLSALAKSHD